jgi:hypothetical protein
MVFVLYDVHHWVFNMERCAKGGEMKEPHNFGWKSKASWKNPDWKYVPSAATDVSKTIARVRREMRELQEQAPRQVVQLKKVAK